MEICPKLEDKNLSAKLLAETASYVKSIKGHLKKSFHAFRKNVYVALKTGLRDHGPQLKSPQSDHKHLAKLPQALDH
jgi:hypothetical protein